MFCTEIMERSIRHLVNNPPTLKLLSVCRIRQSISCLRKNVERNLIKKLRNREYDYLRNPSVPISVEDMCLMERKFILESCLRSGSWGLLEMFILLTDDVVAFDVRSRNQLEDLDDLDTVREKLAPAIEIKLHYEQYSDLFLSLLMVKCPKLKSLTLGLLTPLHTALEKFCKVMPHITKLDLSLEHYSKGHSNNNKYDGVLRAIGANMHHLKCLDISYSTVKSKAIKYLLPTEDNALGGCPELVELDLLGIITVDVKLLKKILLALPKLRLLGHQLLVNALVDLTEEEMRVDTARSLFFLDSWIFPEQYVYFPSVRFDILAESPVFQRLINSITTACITIDKREQKHSALVASVLPSLTKLRTLQLTYISETSKHFLPVLESIGGRLHDLIFRHISESISVQDIMRKCPKLTCLKLEGCQEDNAAPGNGINLYSDQIEEPRQRPVLHCLTRLCLGRLDKQVCSADMLIALLRSPDLKNFKIINLEVMSDDVMFNILPSPGCGALLKVTQFSMEECPLITAAPFVHWLTMANCSLQHIRFSKCENVDCEILGAVAEKCRRAVIINETYF